MRIKELKIYSQDLQKQTDFYTKTIGLDLIERSPHHVIFQIGESRLKIVKDERFRPYHFAINIPCNQESEALQWLKERVEILKDGNNEIQQFDNWNAKAVYFYDADNNIVEFIARQNLRNERFEDFGTDSLLEISEIGIPVNDISTAYNSLKNIAHLEIYDGEFERFCAIGDEHGLFICINKKVKDWFPTGDIAHASEFEIKFRQNGSMYELQFVEEEIKT